MQIGIIGCGNVGTSTAFALIYSEKVSRIKLYNRNQNKLKGITMDLQDAAYINDTIVTQNEIQEMTDCEYIIITTGRKQKKEENRINLYEENFKIVNHYLKLLTKYKNTIILVTNPVDLISNKVRELYPYINILSTKTHIDKIRLNQLTNKKGEIVGTHDTDKRVLINNKTDIELTEMVNKKANEIIYYKGDTCYGIASVIKNIIEGEIQ